MKERMLLIIICLLLFGGCAAIRPAAVSPPSPDQCSLPSGTNLAAALERARQTLSVCPAMLDDVLAAVIDVARNRPDPGNVARISEMLDDLVKEDRIAATDARQAHRMYFSPEFLSIPDVRLYIMTGDSGPTVNVLKRELELKRLGMLECGGDRASWEEAKAEYNRLLELIERLVSDQTFLNMHTW